MAQRHRITRYTVLLTIGGLALNLLLSRLVLWLELPLFLDSVGTILAAILGGYLPGILVGFFANIINGISDPITLYYAVINILLACAAAFLSKRRWFQRLGTSFLSVLVFSFIGGGLGSVLTWLLYGFSFGSGISAPFALALHELSGFSEFLAQFLADMAIDLADKLLTVALCLLILRLLPRRLLGKLAAGHYPPAPSGARTKASHIRRSLRTKVVLLISVSAAILGTAATCIGSILYTDTMEDQYIDVATWVTETAAQLVEADQLNGYLSAGEETQDYLALEARLQALRDSAPDVEYLYIYQIRADGCHVIFDTDTPELPGGTLGDVLPIEPAFDSVRESLLAGDAIPAILSNDTYGWLLTVYTPLRDSAGTTVAYAAADISMEDVTGDRAVFVIKMTSLLFGVSILIVAFALWYAERRLVDPINAMADAASRFAYDSEKERLETTERIRGLEIRTQDEIENLYHALEKTVSDVSAYITDINKKNRIISQMQHNIIMSFANMVENRDTNTGHHIKHTAAYVDAIARELYREGRYPEILNPGYIEEVVRCAPLHDLGKIEVPDAVLNKPGKLTPEEFDLIKRHTLAGRHILLGILENSEDPSYLSEAVNMTSYHHERWDGAGYPCGLSGEEIPLSARIMAVADVYDALISKRSYKEAMPGEQAAELIRQESGSHFDPVVVEAFLQAKETITAVSFDT